MRLFLIAVCLSAATTVSTAIGGNDEPLTGGSTIPRDARFEASPAQQYLIARARSDSMHRQSILRQYDLIGYDYGRPLMNAGVYYLAVPPVRTRQIYSYPGTYVINGYGY